MITGFGKYLIDNGFKRYRYEWHGHGKEKRQVFIEDYETQSVSSLGLIEYTYRKDNVWCYWGLYIKDHAPKFFIVDTGRPEDDYFDTSDYEKALQRITDHSAMIIERNRQNDIAIKRFMNKSEK